MNYVGLDVHKRTISFCVRSPDGTILQEGSMTALREELDKLLAEVPAPCVVGLESTLFTAWVYDHLTAKGISVKVAHPAMLKAIFAGKRKNDEIDARKLADLLRCNYFPECHIASREIRDLPKEAGRSPSPLDLDLSWMSAISVQKETTHPQGGTISDKIDHLRRLGLMRLL